jgi:hypothetical protein
LTGWPRRGRRWKKMQETIEPEDYKYDSEQDAGNQGHDLHGAVLL